MPFQIQSLFRLLAECGVAVAMIAGMSSTAHADLELRQQMSLMLSPQFQSAANDGLIYQELTAPPELPISIDLTTQSTNLWDRIRNGFAMTNLNDDLVLYYQQYYLNRPESLRRMIERARPYLHHIVAELESRGMPTELALLPMVESAFNPMANSPAKASGLWQFIPSTGRRFKLEQNWWQDERRDVFASTQAALDYLQTIYDMHGDWHLALASYNWGEGAVKRAIEKNEARGLPTDYPNLTMPNETRHYVPKLQALKNILGDRVTYTRLGLPEIANEAFLATLETRRPMDVTTAAHLANISVDEFRRLNPSHNRPIIKPDSTLILPADRIDLFRKNLQNQQTPLSQWQAYSVRAPERVDQIASRFDTTTSELIRVNGLPGNVRLAAGSKLLVPGYGSSDNLRGVLGMNSSPVIIQPDPPPCKMRGKGKKAKCVKVSSNSKADTDSKSSRTEKPGKSASSKDSPRDNKRDSGKSSSSSRSKPAAKSNVKDSSKTSTASKAKAPGKRR